MLIGLLLALTIQQASIETVARDTMSQVQEPAQLVARTDAEWAAMWKRHAGDKPLPKVDLKTRTIVAVFLGSRSSGGYSVEITGIRQESGGAVIQWQERAPAAGTISAQVITSPAAIATIPRTAGAIRFEKAVQ